VTTNPTRGPKPNLHKKPDSTRLPHVLSESTHPPLSPTSSQSFFSPLLSSVASWELGFRRASSRREGWPWREPPRPGRDPGRRRPTGPQPVGSARKVRRRAPVCSASRAPQFLFAARFWFFMPCVRYGTGSAGTYVVRVGFMGLSVRMMKACAGGGR